MNATPRTAIWPSLRYRDANAAIAFLVAAFGWSFGTYAGAAATDA